MDQTSTLDLTRSYLQNMSENDRSDLELFARHIFPGLPSDIFSGPDPRIDGLITKLPKLTEHDLALLDLSDANCPICFVPFTSILAEEEHALAMDNSPAVVPEELGVTKLNQSCGHIYCRKDIVKWMRTASGSCPTCRRPFLPPLSPTEQVQVPDAAETTRFGALATPSEMDDFLLRVRQSTPTGGAGSGGDLEARLSEAGVLADFERIMFGATGTLRRSSEPSSGQGHNYGDDREEFSGMYS